MASRFSFLSRSACLTAGLSIVAALLVACTSTSAKDDRGTTTVSTWWLRDAGAQRILPVVGGPLMSNAIRAAATGLPERPANVVIVERGGPVSSNDSIFVHGTHGANSLVIGRHKTIRHVAMVRPTMSAPRVVVSQFEASRVSASPVEPVVGTTIANASSDATTRPTTDTGQSTTSTSTSGAATTSPSRTPTLSALVRSSRSGAARATTSSRSSSTAGTRSRSNTTSFSAVTTTTP